MVCKRFATLLILIGLGGLVGAPTVSPALGEEPAASNGGDRAASGWFARIDEGATAWLEGNRNGGRLGVKSQPAIRRDRAQRDAWERLEQAVVDWLSPHVPSDWRPDPERLDALILERRVEPRPLDAKRLGLDPALDFPEHLYVAALTADLSPEHRSELLADYRRDLGNQRLRQLGAVGGFFLTVLAILAAYIRADEATKGYFTNRLRLAALTAAGAAGYGLYRFLV